MSEKKQIEIKPNKQQRKNNSKRKWCTKRGRFITAFFWGRIFTKRQQFSVFGKFLVAQYRKNVELKKLSNSILSPNR
jgi:hypothetical protein